MPIFFGVNPFVVLLKELTPISRMKFKRGKKISQKLGSMTVTFILLNDLKNVLRSENKEKKVRQTAKSVVLKLESHLAQ